MDCRDEVFVWIGAEANEVERSTGLKIAEEYINSDPTGRDPDDVTIYQIRQGYEPPNFRAHFAGWDFKFQAKETGTTFDLPIYHDYFKGLMYVPPFVAIYIARIKIK